MGLDAARRWAVWARASAEALATRLRAGGVPRLRRTQARNLLAEAFAALAQWDEAAEAVGAGSASRMGVEGPEGEGAQAATPADAAAAEALETRVAPTVPPSVGRLRSLALALDRLATPPVRPIPRPTLRSILRAPGAVDRRQVNRIVGYWEWAEGLGARRAEFLARAGFEMPMRMTRDVVEGSPPEIDRVFTEG